MPSTETLIKYLTLFRHAKSSWQYPLEDKYRPLNERGLRQGQLMAQQCELPVPDIIYCSEASRAYSTALFYLQAYNLPVSRLALTEDLYQSPLSVLVSWLMTLSEEFNQVWLFGHNPQLTDLANYLCPSPKNGYGIKLATAAYVSISLQITHWSKLQVQTGHIAYFNQPNKKPV